MIPARDPSRLTSARRDTVARCVACGRERGMHIIYQASP